MTSVKRLSQGEFVALTAALFAMVAISIDAMLPALPEIAATMSPDAPNRAQLVITSFVFGMGLGTLFVGPLADAFGRKPVIYAGTALYAMTALACYFANSLDTLLVARVLQGISVAAARVVSMAIMRDLFKGREMAKIMSFVMMVFIMVPAIAPLMGQAIIALASWHAIFLVYILFAAVIILWFGLRQPETLSKADRRPLDFGILLAATKELFTHRIVVISILAQTLTMAALFATLSSMQGIFEQRFDRAASFPLWFAFIALGSASGSIINSRVVMRLGMRPVITAAYTSVLALTLVLLVLIASSAMPEMLAFPAHILWSIALFSMMSLTMGNLNALAMEPVGHIAGLAASVMTSVATVASVVLAVPVGLAFNGTAMPLMAGVAVFVACALALMRLVRR
ncbi:MAG: multidrug effflux MFS transporter [Cypionkella sp.]|uniref:multidrug effflux MFS transporter n=1 Tax=Cypionkella sp. TaxID=2811411 RepID=UPI00271A0480|nr:multidrug effflux MFS transporter [Cypionkella sp.]MDO8328178.1 multidrug effflux MFS transporter [Cypionkella sp.]